jgi:hypothetical protein
MNAVLRELRGVQRALRANMALETFARAILVCLLCECGMAIGFKLTFGEMPEILIVLGFALPVAIAIVSTGRITLLRAAASADRDLRLDERLSTSLETMQQSSPVSQAQLRDAERALRRADLNVVRRLKQPRELYFACATGLVFAAILLAPDPVKSQGPPPMDPAQRADLKKLEMAVASLETEPSPLLRRTQEKIREQIETAKRNPEATEELIRTLREKLDALQKKLQNPNLDPAERRAIERAIGSLEGAGSGLASRVRGPAAELFFKPRMATEIKMEARTEPDLRPHVQEDELPKGVGPSQYAARIQKVMGERAWPPRYDPIVSRFFGVEP